MGNETLWLLHGRELRSSTTSFGIQYTDLKINFIKDFFIECKWFGIHTCHNALVDVRGPFSGLGSLLPCVQGIKQGPSLLCVSGVFNTEPSFLSRLDMFFTKETCLLSFAISRQECVSRIMLQFTIASSIDFVDSTFFFILPVAKEIRSEFRKKEMYWILLRF